MLVSFADIPLVVCFGILSAISYRRVLFRRNASWYLFLTGLVVIVFWLDLVAANHLGVSYWDVGIPTTELPLFGGVLVALSYPLWFRAAGELTFVLLGRRPDQGGLLWVFRLSDRTNPIDPAWNATDTIEDDDPGES